MADDCDGVRNRCSGPAHSAAGIFGDLRIRDVWGGVAAGQDGETGLTRSGLNFFFFDFQANSVNNSKS